jgi:hypothetical protein
LGPHYVRLVKHGDLTSAQIEHAADEIGKLINRA